MDVLTAITHRLAELATLSDRIDAEKAELEAAARALRRYGPSATVADAPAARTGTIKSLVLATLRDAHPRGMNRRTIMARMRREHGIPVLPDSVTSALGKWSRVGLVRRVGKMWFATSGTGDLLDEP